ncbi:MAG: hypothetical protein RLZZ312_1972 [Bacteroidota bacterium]|jgi:5-formyltetrahydrofolate cyclo-ligase
MTKTEARITYKKYRSVLSINDIKIRSTAIAEQVQKMDIWHYDYYHIFMPIDHQKEVDTQFIFDILEKNNKKIIVSKSILETVEMLHYVVDKNTKFQSNRYGIPEPINANPIETSIINVVFVPLLAYDSYGNRVGYGKGFYDKFLSKCQPNVVKIGLSFFEPESLISGFLNSDVKLDYCAGPTALTCF